MTGSCLSPRPELIKECNEKAKSESKNGQKVCGYKDTDMTSIVDDTRGQKMGKNGQKMRDFWPIWT